ncbi:FAD-dependent oxidoreductase [Laedolimicola intestinihominis]|uniref:FAD-dependent oxidoreductase n=1 Tax=Laedolimicola intestinihominis TaxID=3133166 RepID=A0ABV1FJ12_9FIRM
MQTYDIVIVGGGPAGLAAALAARENGVADILILEREDRLGGILNQCIHNGFGLHTFQEELTGPEYAARYIEKVEELQIPYKLQTMVLNIMPNKRVAAMNREDGLFEVQAKAVILAMGCRERPRGALNIPGFRPAGIYTAGTAQRLVNIEGFLPGRKIVILGSGDIGLIMARRLTLEGARVQAVVEILPKSGGLQRNIVQCLEDFDIPLLLRHTVVDIKGRERVSGVTVSAVDEQGKPIPGTGQEYDCDTLLLSVGLIPENELTRELGARMDPATHGPVVNEKLETTIPGVFACGNVLHVHGLVDSVSEEAAEAGKNAAVSIKQTEERRLTCIICPKGCSLRVRLEAGRVTLVEGNHCKRGAQYAEKEVTNPTRTVTTIIPVRGGREKMLSVKTRTDIPKAKVQACMRALKNVTAEAPVQIGNVILADVAETGVDIIATKEISEI